MPLRPLLAVLAAAALVAGCAGRAGGQAGGRDPARATCAALQAGLESLVQRVEPDGRLRYRLDGRLQPGDGYNVVRHAGTLWQLQRHHALAPDPALADALDRASGWLATCCLRPLPGWPAAAAVFSDPEGDPGEAKLGAAGLALAAWSGLAAQGRPAPSLAQRRALARFIVYQQAPDGRFIAKYRDGRRDPRWVSLYYPGEAVLGLVAHAALDPDPTWLTAARRGLQHLADSRALPGAVVPPDHWALIATAALARQDPSQVAALASHTRAVSRVLLEELDTEGRLRLRPGRSAPAATRLEGLAAAEALLAADPHPQARLLLEAIPPRLAAGADFLRSLQRQHPPLAGAVRRGGATDDDPRRDELRVDDTQHALGVWLGLVQRQKYTCTRP